MGWNSIQGKLIGLVVAGCLVLALVGIWGSQSERAVAHEFKRLLEHNVQVNEHADHLNISFKTQVDEWKNVLLRGHAPADGQKHWQAFLEQHRAFNEKIDALLKMVSSTNSLSQLHAIKEQHNALLSKYEAGRSAFEQAGFDPKVGDAAVKGVDRELSQSLERLADELSQTLSAESLRLIQASEAIATRTLAAEVVLTLLVAALMIWGAKSQVLSPLTQVVEQVQRLASGDYSKPLASTRQDEVGQLYSNIEHLRGALCGMIAGVRSTATALTQVNQELNQAAASLGKDTEKTQSYSGQIAVAINEMTSTVNEVSRNAAQTADATVRAENNLQQGTQTMNGAIAAITRVADEVAQTSNQMNRLKEESTSVGAVLDVIKGIAEQTNLLALNAAIEAARAGEQGRGFAVVADEVRALAKRTQESTEEIQQIIKALQDGASSAAQAMVHSASKTRESVEQAASAGRTLSEIAGAIGSIRDMTHQIAAAAEEQSHAADEINRNVVNLATLAENAHSHARKTDSVAQGLNQTSKDLQSMVAEFRL
ncbi:MAG: hypothetical protein RL497_340 [Pseudomonadota bacterium]|jgi:methyl-accepting chemotaxis protein